MRVLLTNNTLSARAGTELYVRDVALKLRELGHQPVCFSFDHGPVAEELRGEGIAVTAELGAHLRPLDLIHGHHRIETTLAAMAFPDVPVLSFCHGPKVWPESPCIMPNVVGYVAVDLACEERLINEGIPKERIRLLLNFVDTRRFRLRDPLPDRPRRALVFSNSASETSHLPAIREACAAAGIRVDVAGAASGMTCDDPENLLPQYDLVFAKARAAIEAMAVGCAVIQCDYFGAGHLITPERFDALRQLNFGFKSMQAPVSVEHLAGEIGAYNPEGARRVAERIRSEASLDRGIDHLIACYQDARATPFEPFDPWVRGSAFLAGLVADAKEGVHLRSLSPQLQSRRTQLHSREIQLQSREIRLQARETQWRFQEKAMLQKCASLKEKLNRLREKHARVSEQFRQHREAVREKEASSRRRWWKRLFRFS